MKICKKIIAICLIAIALLSFFGCSKVIEIKSEPVEAVVVDTIYQAPIFQPMRVGKVTTIRTIPAKYYVKVEYQNYKLTINNATLYNQYKDNIGESINCYLITKYYEDGTSKTYLSDKEIVK